jgi:curved DNA-binding protein CbpA
MSERDYYEILGLPAGADGSTVNKTYWNLARKYQALATSDPRAHAMLDELNEAYNVLGTPALRDQFDAERATRPSTTTEGETYPASARNAFVTPSGGIETSRTSWRHKLISAWRRGRTKSQTAPDSIVTHGRSVEARVELAATPVRRGSASADEIRSSTASMVGRWRARAAAGAEVERAPDSTLVDIFRSELEIESQSEPLSAVLDVLRGSRSPVESR